MKKLIFVMAVMFGMMACTGNSTSNNAVEDTVAVDTVTVDSVK